MVTLPLLHHVAGCFLRYALQIDTMDVLKVIGPWKKVSSFNKYGASFGI